MKKPSRKELRQNTAETLNNLLSQFEISSPSKRTKKVVEKVSKRFSNRLKQEIKRKLKQNQKATKKTKSAKAELKTAAAA